MDYKKYSLEQLENWIHNAVSCSEASPQEIYHFGAWVEKVTSPL